MASKSINITFPSLSSLGIQIKLDGKWGKLDTLASNLAPSISKGYEEAVKLYSKRLLRIIKKSLITGIPPEGSGVTWPPLAPSTIKRYGQHNIYNLTGLYANSVGLHEYKSRTIIGLPIQKKRSSAGKITLNQLAILLEYGSKETEDTGSIPPRPLWRPALASVGGKKQLKADIMKNIRSKLLSSTGIRPNQIK